MMDIWGAIQGLWYAISHLQEIIMLIIVILFMLLIMNLIQTITD